MMAETHYAFTTTPLEVDSSPDCGGIWTSNPGNSTNPPATVPQYMAVIVAGSVEKKGSNVFGNIKGPWSQSDASVDRLTSIATKTSVLGRSSNAGV